MTDLAIPTEAPRNPGLLRRQLIAALAEWRKAANMTLPQAGAVIGKNQSTVSRLETGDTAKIRPEYVQRLLTAYGAPQDVVLANVQKAIDLAMAGKRGPGWYEAFGGAPSSFLGEYLDLEAEAVSIDVWHPMLWPGILHTADYARAVIGAFGDISAEGVEQRVRLRVARQGILDREGAPTLRVLIDESALKRQVGGHAVLAAQLARAAELARRPGITIQVLPSTVGVHPGVFGGQLTVFGFGPGTEPTAYTESYTGGQLFSAKDETASHVAILEAVRELALGEAESLDMLAVATAAA